MNIVIFDMDGTLLDSKKDLTISINFVREKNHDLFALSEEFVVDAINLHERNLSKLFYDTEVYEAGDRELFEWHYDLQCIKTVYLYDGVEKMIKALVESGVKISVATNAPTQFALRMLEHLGVKNCFDFIVGADMVKNSKPSADMINHILKNYGYDAKKDRAWMVGDNSKDILSAQNASIEAIFAAWGFASTSEHIAIAKKPHEILEMIFGRN